MGAAVHSAPRRPGPTTLGTDSSDDDFGLGSHAAGRDSEMSMATFVAHCGKDPNGKDDLETISFVVCGEAGRGSFGVVKKIRLLADGQVYALKKTAQDRRFKNRELEIMLALDHPCLIELKYWFFDEENEKRQDDVRTLNLVLEYYPETIFRAYRSYVKQGLHFPQVLVQIYMFQLLRACAYLHSCGVCHRDLKPQNLLVDPMTGRLKLIDFGSAKVLRANEGNVSYTCSRYYRAPELIFGATYYTLSVDLWSIGCVLGELFKGEVLFAGKNGIDQLVSIIKVRGTPTQQEIASMNPTYVEHSFPQITAVPLQREIPNASKSALSLLDCMINYDPSTRKPAIELLLHPFFDDLRQGPVKMPNGRFVSHLFQFTPHELSIRPDLVKKLVPEAQAKDFLKQGLDIHNFVPLDLSKFKIDVE